MDDRAPSGDGTVLAQATVDTSGWLPATVPGTVPASLVDQGTYWRYREPSAMQALNSVQQTRISASVTSPGASAGGDGRRQVTATVRNRGAAVAAMVRLSLLDARSGARVLPTLYDDNYLWLLPGESRTPTLSFPQSALSSGDPELHVEAYTARPPPPARDRFAGQPPGQPGRPLDRR